MDHDQLYQQEYSLWTFKTLIEKNMYIQPYVTKENINVISRATKLICVMKRRQSNQRYMYRSMLGFIMSC